MWEDDVKRNIDTAMSNYVKIHSGRLDFSRAPLRLLRHSRITGNAIGATLSQSRLSGENDERAS